jgi:hypothetical protein
VTMSAGRRRISSTGRCRSRLFGRASRSRRCAPRGGKPKKCMTVTGTSESRRKGSSRLS